MSAAGPRPPKRRFYGRVVRLEVRTHAKRLLLIGVVFLALGTVAIGFGFARVDALGLVIGGGSLFLLGAFFAFAAHRVNGIEPYIKVGIRKLSYPHGGLIWRRTQTDYQLADIRKVMNDSEQGVAGVRIIYDDDRRWFFPAPTLPTSWNHRDFGLLLHLRALGARKDLHRTQQAALEAHVFEGTAQTLGVVVNERGKRPKVVAIVDDLDDFGSLLSATEDPTEAVLVVPSDAVTETRQQITGALITSLAVNPDRVLQGEGPG